MSGRNPETGNPSTEYGADVPSESERKDDKREYLARNGCTVCGNDDPNNLEEVWVSVPPIGQQATRPGAVVCEKHKEEFLVNNQCCENPDFETWDEQDEGIRREFAECESCGETVSYP